MKSILKNALYGIKLFPTSALLGFLLATAFIITEAYDELGSFLPHRLPLLGFAFIASWGIHIRTQLGKKLPKLTYPILALILAYLDYQAMQLKQIDYPETTALFILLSVLSLALGSLSWAAWPLERPDRFFFRIIEQVIISFVFSSIIATALMLTTVGLEQLLGFNFDSQVYFRIIVYSMIFVNSLILATNLSQMQPEELQQMPIPKRLAQLFSFVLTPFSIIYTLITATYLIKSTLTGESDFAVTHALLIGFLIFGLLSYLLAAALQPQTLSWWTEPIKKSFLVLQSLVTIGVLLSISLRVSELGWTINRYLVILGAIWCVITLILLLKSANNFKFAILLLAALSFIGASGYFSAHKTSIRSQINALQSLLNTNELSNAELQASLLAEPETLKRALNITAYLLTTHHAAEQMETWAKVDSLQQLFDKDGYYAIQTSIFGNKALNIGSSSNSKKRSIYAESETEFVGQLSPSIHYLNFILLDLTQSNYAIEVVRSDIYSGNVQITNNLQELSYNYDSKKIILSTNFKEHVLETLENHLSLETTTLPNNLNMSFKENGIGIDMQLAKVELENDRAVAVRLNVYITYY